MANGNDKSKNIANIGDIVIISGFGTSEYQVEGIRFETEINAYFDSESISYDVVNLRTLDYLMAYQEDINVVCKAYKAPDYIRNSGGGATVADVLFPIYTPNIDNVKSDEDKEYIIDGLLDELSDALYLRNTFGDHEDDDKEDRKYAFKVNEIRALLIEATGGEEVK